MIDLFKNAFWYIIKDDVRHGEHSEICSRGSKGRWGSSRM